MMIIIIMITTIIINITFATSGHCSKVLTYINSSNLHKNPLR